MVLDTFVKLYCVDTSSVNIPKMHIIFAKLYFVDANSKKNNVFLILEACIQQLQLWYIMTK